MPNPNGYNSFDHFATEAQQGAIQKMTDLNKAVPVDGAPVAAPALGAAKHMQKVGSGQIKGRKAPAAAPKLPSGPVHNPDTNIAPTETLAPPYRQFIAQAWAEIAQIPGIDPAVQQVAQQAQAQAGFGS